MEPKNREQRRREKYGKAGGVTKDPWPASEGNPALKRAAEVEAADTKQPEPEADTKGPDVGAAPKATKATKPVVARKAVQESKTKKS